MRELRDRLRDMLRPGVEALGFELVDVEFTGSQHRPTVRVYIDSPRGITVDDCAGVSRQVSSILDVEDPLPGSYMLEVSSPGLDRPLVSLDDYRRRVGETVKVKLMRPIDGRRNFTGRVVEVLQTEIVLQVDDASVTLAFDAIERARLVPKF